jgi:hypothetical protein
MSYVPQYSSYNATTGKFGNEVPPASGTYSPITGMAPGSSLKTITTPGQISAAWRKILGRELSAAEVSANINEKLSSADLEAKAALLPENTAKKVFTPDEVRSQLSQVMGRDPTKTELTTFTAGTTAAPTITLQAIKNYAYSQPEYLDPINQEAKSIFAHKQNPQITPLSVASSYQDILNRAPTAAELERFKSADLNTGELKDLLANSAEYNNNLTKSFVPTLSYDTQGVGSIQGALKPQAAQSSGLAALNTAINTQVGNKLAAPSNFNFAAPPSVQPTSPLVPPTASTVVKSDPVAAQLAALQMQKDLTARAEAQGLGSFVPQSANLTSPYSAGSPQFAKGGLSSINGQYNLGGYSDGGRLLRGPGDGVSDSIPAQIGNRRPARLADGEFVIPARIVSELGNGSTDAGARRLYAMMDRIQKARRKTIGKRKIAVNSRADKYLPA